MGTDQKIFYTIKMKPDGISHWESNLGCVLEEVLKPDIWVIDRKVNSIGLRLTELGVIDFDHMFGSLSDFKTLSILPKVLLDREMLTFEKNIKGVKKFLGVVLKSFDPTRDTNLMEHIYWVIRVRFEALTLILVDVIANQETSIRELAKKANAFTESNVNIYELAYRDLLNRSPKEIRDIHIRLNPTFARILNEDAVVARTTTMN